MPHESSPICLHESDHRRRGRRHLAAVDPDLARMIDVHGDPWPTRREPLFERLCRAIVSQQLSVKAAGTILGRLRAAAGEWTPEALRALDDEVVRGCGMSRAKTAAVRDLSDRVADGRLDLEALDGLDDDEVMRRLVTVKGIGPWSAHMVLLFGLGRPDVWATGDQGLRRALWTLDALDDYPEPPAMIERAAAWRPYRGLASLYLWTSLDGGGLAKDADDNDASN